MSSALSYMLTFSTHSLALVLSQALALLSDCNSIHDFKGLLSQTGFEHETF